MIRQSPTVHLILVAAALILVAPASVSAQTTPQDPSYDDQWIETNVESSPFLELRNEGDTDASDGPETPDTPTVTDVQDPEVTGESPEGTKDNEQQTSDSEAPDTEPTSKTERDTQPSQIDEATDDPSSVREQSAKNSESESTAKKSVADLFKELDPLSAGASSVTPELASESVALHDVPLSTTAVEAKPVDPAPASPEPSWWWQYRYWLGGGLVVLFVTGMFFWSRRRRVTVIERNYPSAEDFFQDELKRSRTPQSRDDDSAGGRSFNLDEGPATPASSESLSDSLLATLNEHGFDEKHQALVEKYYGEELSRREVAEQSSLGNGEVGLVLDLADRIREEKTHAERA